MSAIAGAAWPGSGSGSFSIPFWFILNCMPGASACISLMSAAKLRELNCCSLPIGFPVTGQSALHHRSRLCLMSCCDDPDHHQKTVVLTEPVLLPLGICQQQMRYGQSRLADSPKAVRKRGPNAKYR